LVSTKTISKVEFLKRAELLYHWNLTKKEQEILIDLARLHTGSVVLDQWEIFQKRYPGHPAWEFAEWFEMLMSESEGE